MKKTELGEGTRHVLTSNGGGKHKRSYFDENEILLMTNMNDVANNAANALRETGPARCRHVPCSQSQGSWYVAAIRVPGSFVSDRGRDRCCT